jgi:hypothetical protein
MAEQVIIPAPEMDFVKLNFTVAFGMVFDNNGTFANDYLGNYMDFTLKYGFYKTREQNKDSN